MTRWTQQRICIEIPATYDLLTVSEHLESIRRAYKVENNGYGDRLLERFKLADKKDKLGKEVVPALDSPWLCACPRMRPADIYCHFFPHKWQ